MRSAVRICPAAPKSIENFGFRCFFVAKTLKMVWVKMWVNRLTHTVTHTTKCVERFKEHRRGGFCLLSGIFASFFCLHDLCHETAHFLRSLLLHLPSGVGVGAECESGVIVAEHTADGFDVHAILQCQRCEGMSEIMKADMLQSRVLEDFLMKVLVSGVHDPVLSGATNRFLSENRKPIDRIS